MTTVEAFRQLREMGGLKQSDVAERLGLPLASVSMREAGKVRVLPDELVSLAVEVGAVLSSSPSGWLIRKAPPIVSNPERDQEATSDEAAGSLPLLGEASAGAGAFPVEFDERNFSAPEVFTRPIDSVVKVRGDSMVPMLHDGDFIGVRLKEAPQIGDLVVINDASTDTVVVKVYQGRNAGMVQLSSVNPEYPPLFLPADDIYFIGVAWGLMREGRLTVRRR